MELGVDAEIIGHQSERITQRYQHVSSAAPRDATSKLGAHFELTG